MTIRSYNLLFKTFSLRSETAVVYITFKRQSQDDHYDITTERHNVTSQQIHLIYEINITKAIHIPSMHPP